MRDEFRTLRGCAIIGIGIPQPPSSSSNGLVVYHSGPGFISDNRLYSIIGTDHS